MALSSYEPFWSETAILLGAGAMSALGVPTTIQMGKAVRNLAGSENNKSIQERIDEVYRFYGIEAELGYFLTVIGDSLEKDDLDNDKDSIEAAKKILPDNFPEEKIPKKISQWKTHYDWNALRRLAIKVPVENKNYAAYLTDLYNVIDGNLLNNHGVQVYDSVSNKPIFLYPYRLRTARNLLVLLSSLMMACAYHKTRTDNLIDFNPYLDFFKILHEFMQREAINLEGLKYNLREFYLMSYSIISFNFEPLFLWFMIHIYQELNRNPSYIGKRNLPVRIFRDLGVIVATRDSEEPPEAYYSMNESIARNNNANDDASRLYRICKFYYTHGNTNIRECENCGKMMLNWGEWRIMSRNLFSPPPFKTNLFERTPLTKDEEDAYREGDYDAIQCTFCGNMTYAYNTAMVMQTAYKGGHASFLEEIQRDAKVSLSGAKHIVLLGYSLPPDDVIWRSAIVAKQKNKNVYCSVVVGYLGKDRWIEGDELITYVEKTKENINRQEWLDYGINAIDAAIAVFSKENVRAYTGGIPQVGFRRQ